MKVLLVNQYSMENAYDLWKKGVSGSHHVWGKIELDRRGKVEMIIFKHVKYPFLNRIGNIFKITHLDQQIRILFNLKQFDILYAPYSSANTRLLVLLKWLGLFKKPIVVAIHQPLISSTKSRWTANFFSKKLLLQYDASIFLSEALMKKTVQQLRIPRHVEKEKFHTAQWGPDAAFYENDEPNVPLQDCDYFISAGHTDRDYDTLIEAFRDINYSLRIFCTQKSLPRTTDIPPNVRIVSTGIPYSELLKWYRNARAILIPLKYPKEKEGCQGMTSIQDVIALGKPTIMTLNRSLNLDVEKEGFGIFVEMGDILGWKNAISLLIHDTSLLTTMASLAQKTYVEKFNSEIFADKLQEVLVKVYHSKCLKS